MVIDTKFYTALREEAKRKIEHLGDTDIVIGIPTYFSASSIDFVIETIARGLEKYYRDYKALILVSDGGSADDTREVSESIDVKNCNIEKIVFIYRGIPGKGSALRAIFEATDFLHAKAVAVFDSDLKSITPEWVKNFVTPVLKGYDLVSPYYKRYKYDAPIAQGEFIFSQWKKEVGLWN
jgi:glycosyltransferase involved in cell wall biosynthesis